MAGQKEKLFLLDAMALLYRAHFAFISNPRVTSKGVNTSAIFGFTNTLLEIINKEKPSHLAVVFDTDKPTFRHEAFEAYKANRDAQPEDIKVAVPMAKRLLETLNIHCLWLDGYEADDIIGTISHHLDAEKYEVFMVTPDKDYAQLVKENVFLYKPRSRGGGYDIMGVEDIKKKFGLPPEQITDFLGLKGDSVDNIPGIPKVGDKTAVQLLEQFGSVEEIVKRSDEIKKKSIKASVEEFGEQGLQSKELATIMVDVPIEWSVDNMTVGPLEKEKFIELMAELEFRGVTQRALNSSLNPDHNPGKNGSETSTKEVRDLFSEVRESKTFDRENVEYHLIEGEEQARALAKRLREAGSFCFDTETSDLDPMLAELVAVTFSIKANEAWMLYIPESADDQEIKNLLEPFRDVWEDELVEKVGQNLKYDLLVLANYGFAVQGAMFDTMLAHYVLQPEAKHNMDAMSRDMLGYTPISIETLIGKKGKNQKSMREVGRDELLSYACEDSDITLQLKEKLAPQVKGNQVFEEIEMPLMPVLAEMEFAGVTLDQEALAEYSEELDDRLKTLEKEIYKLAGEEFNINSPKQLGDILFDKLKLGKGEKQKKTKTGQYVTNEQTLSDLAVHHELPEKVLAYRGNKKLKSTYVDALPKLINPKTGRVHTTFSQSVAATGRLSSVNPNLQNIPIRTADGREVRKGFIPRGKEYTLLSADYSQVELRIMAALSGDEAMIEAFAEGQDIHRASAARVFGIKPEEVTSDQRAAAKTVNFGIIYGISAFGLSQRMGISRTDAKDIIDNYFEQYPKVKAYMDHNIQFAREKGYVETFFGRRRYLPEINSRNQTIRGFAERNAINSPIQGTAADIIKLAMIKIDQEMKKRDLESLMILQVHDELVFDVKKGEMETMQELVRAEMVGAVDLQVPMEVEMGTGQNWLEAH